jgi:hypothetical protein
VGPHRTKGAQTRPNGIELTLRKPSRVHKLIADAGFTIPVFQEPEPIQNPSDAEVTAIAKLEVTSVETVHQCIERTSALAHIAAFLAVRPA